MATEAPGSTAAGEITITVKGPSELKLSISIAPTKTVAELKEQIAAKSDVEKERQRLIYSGKVLKDDDPIAQYKIQNGHTIHMVKGQLKSAADQASASSTGATPGAVPRLPQMGTGMTTNDPADMIERHQAMTGGRWNPMAEAAQQFQGMGMQNLADPNAINSMMQSPEFMQHMSEMMARPEVVEQIIASNPQMAHMAPQIRQTMQSPFFRQLMSNPEALRAMMQMQNAMGGPGAMGGLGGMNPFGAAGGQAQDGTAQPQNPNDPFANIFAPPAPAAAAGATGGQTTGTGGAAGAGAGATGAGLGQAGQAFNPLAAMYGLGGPQAQGGAGAGGQPPIPFGGFNPFMFGGGNPFGAPAAPRDTRPPEEIYATQLGQLNAMGLWDAQKNIRALRTTGGNVEAAIEMIFSGALDGPAPPGPGN